MATKTIDQLAREVIQGKWGNGAERKQKLTAAGYDYNAVQARVNELMGVKTSSSSSKTTTAPKTTTTPQPSTPAKAPEPTYKESDIVKKAAEELASHLKNKPNDYVSPYAAQIEELYNRFVNRPDFSYDFNADPLYQQYKDQYVQLGNLAMRDAMGQAAALTGGYGSSYAQTVGQQAYDAYLQQLNNVIPELYQLAYQRYRGETEDLLNQWNMLQQQESTAYGRYRDEVQDFYDYLDFLLRNYQGERQFDYGKHIDARDFEYQKYIDEQRLKQQAESIALQRAQLEEQKRQFNEELELKKTQAAQKAAESGVNVKDMNELVRTMYEKTDEVGKRIYSDLDIASQLWAVYGKYPDFDSIAATYRLPSGRLLADVVKELLETAEMGFLEKFRYYDR